jgi:hypothetical protein
MSDQKKPGSGSSQAERRAFRDPAGGKLVMPTPQLPDDTPIDKLRLTTRMREAENSDA